MSKLDGLMDFQSPISGCWSLSDLTFFFLGGSVPSFEPSAADSGQRCKAMQIGAAMQEVEYQLDAKATTLVSQLQVVQVVICLSCFGFFQNVLGPGCWSAGDMRLNHIESLCLVKVYKYLMVMDQIIYALSFARP